MSRFQSRLAMLMVAAVVAVTAPNVKSVANSPPVGVDDNFEVVEGTRLVVDAPGLLVNDFDPDGDPIASGFHSDPADGTILAMAQDGAFTYEPDPGFVGVDSFAYAVRDDLGSFTGLVVDVTITVTAAPDPTTSSSVPNGPPVGVDDAFEVAENTTLDVAAPGVVANDSDPDADPISVALITATSNGEIVAKQVGSFLYTPDPGFTGVDSFRYAVEDDQGTSTGLVVDVVITVTPTPRTRRPIQRWPPLRTLSNRRELARHRRPPIHGHTTWIPLPRGGVDTSSAALRGHRNDIERVDPGRPTRRRVARDRVRRSASPERCRPAFRTGVTR